MAIPRAEILTKDELLNLIQKQKQPFISIYMPTHWIGADTQQNQIRFKNLLREAQEKALSAGMRPGEVETLFAPAQELHRNSLFWKKQNDGLAVFIAPGLFRYYRLPLDFHELLVVSERSHIKPVLPLFSSSGRFYVIALSQAKIRVLQGFRNCITEIDIEPLGLPKNMDEVLRFDVQERETRAQPAAAGIGGGGGVFHGHGGWSDYPKDNIMRYLLQVDRGLQKLLKEEHEPLVFAGVEYIFSMYREANTYAYLTEDFIQGNPETLSAKELGKRAWEISKPYHEKSLKEAIERYRQSAGTGLASDNILEIVPAASHGRVGVLFVAKDREQWGSFNPGTGEVALHKKPQKGDEDILDFAALQTFLNRGDVFIVEKGQMPEGEPVAALFRY